MKIIKTAVYFCFIVLLFARPLCAQEDTMLLPDTDISNAINGQLVGTFINAQRNGSFAVINNNGSNNFYRLGDYIGDYRITSIVRGCVYFAKDNKVYTLGFPYGSVNAVVFSISENERVINRSALVQRFLGKNVLAQALPLPYIENGKMQGVKIINIRDKKLAAMAGIKDGDVVTSVNGHKIDSFASALSIYNEARSQQNIRLEFKSDGIIKSVSYHMN